MKCWRIFHFFLFFVYDGTYIFRVWEAMNSTSLGICSVLENTGVERECRHHLHQCLSRGSILSDLSRASVDKMDTSWAPWLKWRWPDCPPNFSIVQLILPLLRWFLGGGGGISRATRAIRTHCENPVILWIRTLRPREVWWFAKVTHLLCGKSKAQTQIFLHPLGSKLFPQDHTASHLSCPDF